jgi:hypothetical protein
MWDVKITNHDYKEKQDPMLLKSARDFMLFTWDLMFISKCEIPPILKEM